MLVLKRLVKREESWPLDRVPRRDETFTETYNPRTTGGDLLESLAEVGLHNMHDLVVRLLHSVQESAVLTRDRIE